MKTFKQLMIVLAVAVVAVVTPSAALAQDGLYTTATTCYTSATVSASQVVGDTTFTLPSDSKGVVFYVDFGLGSLTNAVVSAAGAINGNPASTGYHANTSADASLTLTATGLYAFFVDKKHFAAYQYGGVIVKGTGTVTNSWVQVKYKIVY